MSIRTREELPTWPWGDPAACDTRPERVAVATDRHDFYYRDLEKTNATLHELGAVKATPDGFVYIDQAMVPADLIRAYQGLASYGYAHGLIDAGGGR